MLLSPLALLLVSMQTGLPLPPSMDAALHISPMQQPAGLNQVAATPQGGRQFAAGSIDSDDFNRATLGSGWTQIGSAAFSISADTLVSGAGNEWMQRTGLSVDYKDATTEFDLLPGPTGLTYTAAVTGGGATDRLWTKVQSNGGGGVYDFIGFYHLTGSASGLTTYGGFFAITPVTGGRVRMYITNAGDTMNIDIDEGHDGVFEYHYESSGIIADLGAVLGDEVGIAGYNAQADNWALGDGPSGPTLTVSGTCPGLNTFAVTGSDPFGPIGIVYGPAGSLTLAGGVCAGMTLDVGVPTIAGIFAGDINGDLSFSATLPSGACGLTVQAVDVNNCAPSNTEVL